MKLRSSAVQRGCVRPGEVNVTVVRGGGGPALTALQHAEELLKQEMVTMLHYDALRDPPPGMLPFYVFWLFTNFITLPPSALGMTS